MAGRIKVAVAEDHEIFRRGVITCLAEDPTLEVTIPEHGVDDARVEDADVAVVSGAVARRRRFGCPLVVCAGDGDEPLSVAAGNVVAGVLPRRSVTGAQLLATVRAAAAGLRVSGPAPRTDGLDARELQVLRLLADGRTTMEIARDMSYSERTIKKHIQDLERRLGARSRAHVVAHAIRHGLI